MDTPHVHTLGYWQKIKDNTFTSSTENPLIYQENLSNGSPLSNTCDETPVGWNHIPSATSKAGQTRGKQGPRCPRG